MTARERQRLRELRDLSMRTVVSGTVTRCPVHGGRVGMSPDGTLLGRCAECAAEAARAIRLIRDAA